MKSFVFPAPFPTPPKEGAVAEGETALGPFTLAEAVRVFWSLKSLDLDMSISVKYSAGDTVYADVDERYDEIERLIGLNDAVETSRFLRSLLK